MTMPGGGPHNINGGQITDDSEQAMCLMQALIEMGSEAFNTDILAKWYGYWIDSDPFDIGIATENALSSLSTRGKRNPTAPMAHMAKF